MSKSSKQLETLYAENRQQWREWLQANHHISIRNTAKKNILYWIGSAKRSETRAKRISLTIDAVAQNKNPLKR